MISCSNQSNNFPKESLVDLSGLGVGKIVVKIDGLPSGVSLEDGITITSKAYPYFRETIRENYAEFLVPAPLEYELEKPKNIQYSIDPIVSSVYENPTPNTEQILTVDPGKTVHVTVSYKKRQGTGGLWGFIGNWERPFTDLVAFDAKDLNSLTPTSTTLVPSIRMSGLLPTGDFSFAKDGSMWTTGHLLSGLSSWIDVYSPAKLNSGTIMLADGRLDLGGGHSIQYFTLDRSGNLWVSLNSSHVVARIPATSVSAGMMTPDVIFTKCPNCVISTNSMGDLFIIRGNTYKYEEFFIHRIDHTVAPFRLYDISKLEGVSSTLTIDVSPSTYGVIPYFIFDQSDNLWISSRSNWTGSLVVRILKSEFPLTGSLSKKLFDYPVLVFPTPVSFTSNIAGIDFDNSGKLWHSSDLDIAGRKIVMIQQIDTSRIIPGSNTPVILKSGSTSFDSYQRKILFNPPACGLPIYGSRPC